MYACRMQHFAIDRLVTGCLCHRSDCWKRAVAQSIESVCAHISRRMDIVSSFMFSKLFTNPKWVSIFDAVSLFTFFTITHSGHLYSCRCCHCCYYFGLLNWFICFLFHIFSFNFGQKQRRKKTLFSFCSVRQRDASACLERLRVWTAHN